MNKIMSMYKQETIIDGIVDNNYMKVIAFEEYEWDCNRDEAIMIDKTYKLQIKIHGFLLSKFHTIKTWKFDIRDAAADELAKNEAVDLFYNIINPYKYGNI